MAWAAAILGITSIPNARMPGPEHSDKAGHFAMYAPLGALAAASWVAAPLLLVTLIGAAFGAIDEYHQRFIAGRSASWIDWAADVAGVFVGGAVIVAVRRHRQEIA